MLAIQRINSEARPPRFEWLDSEPSFVKGSGSIVVEGSWTADPMQAHSFDVDDAADWAEALGAVVVRFGDAPVEPVSPALGLTEVGRLSKIDERMDKRKGGLR